MNRTALKNYSPQARREFIQAVTDRAGFYGLTAKKIEPITEKGDVAIIGGRAFPRSILRQRRALEERISQQGFDQVMETVAYTWFNRFIALRYMELHGYLDHGYRVLSHPEGKTSPEIVEHAEHVDLPGLDKNTVVDLKLDGSKEADLYRLLLVAQCNALHEALPFLFEHIDDETELLLPDNLLHSDSVIRKLVNEIEEEDWKEVEIIGWLYQFYISEKKDQIIGKVVKSEDIPAATQLFTPNWIVKYLVQNTLGHKWLATYPDSPLRKQMEYYIVPAKQTPEVQAQLKAITPESLNPEELTLLDPACGSGHILVEAYDLFKAIYQERGYRSRDIPKVILQKNLYGLEIDDRAAQLAAFALLMKARADDRSIFADHILPNVLAIQESKGLERLLRPDAADASAMDGPLVADQELFPDTKKQLPLKKQPQESLLAVVEPCLRELIKLFEYGKTLGSLICVPPKLAAQLPVARQTIGAMITKEQLWENRAATLLLPLVSQGELLANTYDVVVTNPPYMGSKFYARELKSWVNHNYTEEKSDLYSCFIRRNIHFCQVAGFMGMITIPNWMFLSGFEALRVSLLRKQTIDSFVHNGRGVWGADFGSCSFVIRNSALSSFQGTFKRLFDKQSNVPSPEELIARFFSVSCFTASSNDLAKIPGSPIAYWVSGAVRELFQSLIPLKDIGDTRQGMATSENGRFLRFWYEVPITSIGYGCRTRSEAKASKRKWFPYNKGGAFRRWYGNQDYVVNWKNDGRELLEYAAELYGSPTRTIKSMSEYFKPCVSWSKVSIGEFSVRLFPEGFVFDVAGCCIFFSSDEARRYCLGLLNSKVATALLRILSPTINYEAGHIARLPVHRDWQIRIPNLVVDEAVRIAKEDWDSFETSWEFANIPILPNHTNRAQIKEAWEDWSQACLQRTLDLQKIETENNSAFIAAYGLERELSAEVPENFVAITVSDREEDMQRLISYAIGCMMGRYSLDKPGLVFAHSRNEGFDPSKYRTFPADPDGIVPVTEVGWFLNDATERVVEFVAKAWPNEHLEENLKFIAESLGSNKGEQPRETLRRYLSQSFFKDHLQTYKKRPIYWLFSSGKQKAFQCLVYLHRYHEGTLARMRTEYVIPLQGKITARIEQLASDIQKVTSTSHRKKLEKEQDKLRKQQVELRDFDEKLRHFADKRISLDLDDGVKVNYGKFGDLLAEVKAVCGKSED